ncbi:hypothetical protein [Cyanobium sp. NS01]|nr:hypothetical protein [Cyanobium sp. NS01]
MPRGPQLLVDPRRAVEAAVLLEHRLDLSGDYGVLGPRFPGTFCRCRQA